MLLPSREVAKLMAARARYSDAPPPGGGGGLAEDYVTLSRHELDTLIGEAVRKDHSRSQVFAYPTKTLCTKCWADDSPKDRLLSQP